MTATRDFIDEVKRRTDVVEVIGADVALKPCGKVLKGLSPFHTEKDPSFVVWPGTQSWHDFSNGGSRGGDVIAYLMERRGVGFKEALHELAERAGLRRPEQSDEEYAKELARIAERRELETLLTQAATYYHRKLPSKIRERYYEQHYGFTNETIDLLQLGWADGHLFDYFREHLGLTRAAALKTGLFVQRHSGGVEDFFHQRLVFPYWKQGKVVYFIARKTEYTGDEEWEQAKYKKLLTYSDKHPYVSPLVGNDHFYNEDAARGAEELLITEGVTDCISAMQAGLACISPVTTRFRERDMPKLLALTRTAKRVVICNDAEANGAGEAGALHTAAALHREGRDVRIAALPRPESIEKVDLNEFLKARPPEELRRVLASAKRYVEYLLESIPADTTPAELNAKLEPVLGALVHCPAIERDAYFDAISKRFGVRLRTLTQMLAEIRDRAERKDAEPRVASGRPQIVARGRQLQDIVADAWQVLLAANDPPQLFVRGGALVRIKRDESGARLEALDVDDAYGLALRAADWVHETEDAVLPVFPPHEVARDLLAYPSPDLPRLDEVITAPIFGRDGQVLDRAGYHAGDAVWLELPEALGIEPVPTMPSDADIVAARSLFFDELLVDFPFVDASDRAHMLAALLLPFARRLIEGTTPIHLLEAPTAGTGKGLLVGVLYLLATGRAAEAGTLPQEKDEVRKKITAELVAGRPIVALDNAETTRVVDSAHLAAVTTTEFWTDRKLGQTRSLTLANRALWLLTGNNVRLSSELARRFK